MKSQMFTLLLLIIGVLLFQSTHQYRLEKRELTEYDLTSFIVNTCSADKLDVLIQNLCDQTLESAIMGNFPVLVYYCKMIGSENRYCGNILHHNIAKKNDNGNRLKHHRFVRSFNHEKKSYREEQETNPHLDLKEKQIFVSCLVETNKNSMKMQEFCDKILKEIQQGQYPGIKRLCELHPQSNYCRDVLSFASSFSASWPSLEESLSLLSSSVPSLPTNINLSSEPFESSKLSDVKSIINPEQINKNQK